MILLPLRSAFLMHKIPQRHKIILGMQKNDQSIDLKIFSLVEYPVHVISVVVTTK